jgi:Cft2 family RNA processing exonuclease
MILDDFLYYDTKGLYCKCGDFYIDPQQPVKVAVISHAHADHAIAGNNEVYCTEPTAAFMRLRYGKNAGKAFNIAAHYWWRTNKLYICRAYLRICPNIDGIPGYKIPVYRRL